MMKMIALIGQVNAEVTSRSRRLSISGQVCLMLFSVYTVRPQSQVCQFVCWIALEEDDLFCIFPTVFSFPVIIAPPLPPPTPAKRRLTVMVVNYNYISVPPYLQ